MNPPTIGLQRNQNRDSVQGEMTSTYPITGPTVGPKTQTAIAVARCSFDATSAIVPPPSANGWKIMLVHTGRGNKKGQAHSCAKRAGEESEYYQLVQAGADSTCDVEDDEEER